MSITTSDAEHRPVVVLVGTEECLDRECEDYFTDDGEPNPGVERCSHIRETTACTCQRGDDGEYSDRPCTAAEEASTDAVHLPARAGRGRVMSPDRERELLAQLTEALVEAQAVADTGQPLTAERYAAAVLPVLTAAVESERGRMGSTHRREMAAACASEEVLEQQITAQAEEIYRLRAALKQSAAERDEARGRLAGLAAVRVEYTVHDVSGVLVGPWGDRAWAEGVLKGYPDAHLVERVVYRGPWRPVPAAGLSFTEAELAAASADVVALNAEFPDEPQDPTGEEPGRG